MIKKDKMGRDKFFLFDTFLYCLSDLLVIFAGFPPASESTIVTEHLHCFMVDHFGIYGQVHAC